MRKIALLVLMIPAALSAQTNPPPFGAFTYSAGSWAAAATTSITSPLTYTPPAAALYCYNVSTGKWVPADSTCFGGSGSGFQPNMAAWYVSPNCQGQANCTTIYGDTKYVVDATSNSTTTLTCPDCAFTQADVGKVAWATTQGTGVGVGYLIYTTSVCPRTTIASVTNSTTAVLTDACTASGSGNVVFIWGHDDGTTLAGLDAAIGCNVVHFATAGTFIMTSKPFFKSGSCNQQLQTTVGAPNPAMVGDGFMASQTVFVLTPDFAWSSCNGLTAGGTANGCIGQAARVIANIQLWGTGLTSAANSNCANGANKVVLSANNASSEIQGVDVAGICPGTSGMIGVQVNNADEIFNAGGAQEVGSIACDATTNAGMHLQANDCLNDDISGGIGLKVENGAQLFSYGNVPLHDVIVTGSGTQLVSASSQYKQVSQASGAIILQSGAKLISLGGDVISAGNISVASGTQAQLANTTFIGLANSGTVLDLGGNKYSQTPSTTSTGVWDGIGIMQGTAQGTLTASSTLGFYGFGQFSTPLGTSTTVNQGIVVKKVPLSGSVGGLWVTAGTVATTGTNTVTIMKTHAGSTAATTLTCNLGTSAFCNDSSHFDTPVVGDSYSCQIATGGATPPANVTCGLISF